MTLQDLIDSFREDTDDHGDLNGQGKLWPDAVLTRFFNEAEDEAAVRARLLFDDSIVMPVQEAVSSYQFTALFEITRATIFRQTTAADPLAVPPTPARYEREGTGLRFTSHEEMDRLDCDWRTDRRCPEYLIQDDTRISFPNVIDRHYLLRLEGYRTPLEPMAAPTDEPEIAPQHHRFLVHWVQHRAHSKPDSEVFNPSKSATALAAFEQYFGLRPDAALNKRNQAGRPHRNVVYW